MPIAIGPVHPLEFLAPPEIDDKLCLSLSLYYSSNRYSSTAPTFYEIHQPSYRTVLARFQTSRARVKVLLISQGREFKPRDNRRATFLPPDTSVFPRFGGIQVRNGKREGQRPFFFLPSVLFPLRHHIVLQASNLHPTRFVCIIFPKYVSPYPHRGTLLVYKNFSLSLSLSLSLACSLTRSKNLVSRRVLSISRHVPRKRARCDSGATAVIE